MGNKDKIQYQWVETQISLMGRDENGLAGLGSHACTQLEFEKRASDWA